MLIVVGFFALSNGIHVPTIKTLPDNSTMRTNHIVYQTFLQCQGGEALTAKLRIFAPVRTAVLPDMTVAFIIAKGHFAPGDTIYLDAYVLNPFPGDPSDDHYEDPIPDCPYPFVFVIGQVTSIDNSSVNHPAINILATEYIREQFVQSTLQYVSSC